MRRAEREDHEPESDLATFSERVLAFSIDYGLFAVGYLLIRPILFPDPLESARRSGLLFLLWTALFVIYQAYSSCEGRVSLGKSLLGLRVLSIEREPLRLDQALIRSILYLPSSFLGLGFLWSLFNPTRQSWHDLAAGSIVVSERIKSTALTPFLRAGALACIGLFALAWAWERVLKPRYNQVMVVSYAHVGLSEMGQLQKSYHDTHGRYADSVFALASVSVDPKSFLSDMVQVFDEREGVHFQTSKNGYTIVARARDSGRTPVSYTGS